MGRITKIQSQAHWQVAQTNAQTKPTKELAYPTHGLIRRKHETLTWYIKNWADSGIFKVKTFNQRFIGLIGLELRSAQLFIYQGR